ncbi:hypothetical protein [Phycicoccus sp.]|uniref:hypothetical protein n=1 Tax=Phycicoccus sp. TaxID=1902410 RepID=UPI002C581084|nr:hypothetical protein [Phycicoccus sp.]HMM97303.1 hypothetical protein [Phycicoccus sp.]
MPSTRLLTKVGAVAAAATAAVVLTPGAANAYGLLVKATSPNGQAYGTTQMGFQNENVVHWDDIYLNDRCDPNNPGEGDGVRAKMKFYIKQYGNTVNVGYREDVGGCTSAPYRGSAYWVSNGPMDKVGMSVCSKGGCSAIKWVVRP